MKGIKELRAVWVVGSFNILVGTNFINEKDFQKVWEKAGEKVRAKIFQNGLNLVKNRENWGIVFS